jgi:hypothetical protein
MRVFGDELLGLPVRVHGIELGRPVDVILAPSNGRRALGLDVLCGDAGHRFLPLAAASVGTAAIEIGSTLTLLDDAELEYYRERGSTLRSLRGAKVERGGRAVGALRDLRIGSDGSIEAVLVETSEGDVELPYAPDVQLPRR